MKIGGYRSAFTPFTDALLAAKTLATVLPLYEQYQQGQQQNAVNASLAAGKPVTELPRTGFGALGAKLGLLSPTAPVDPNTQNLETLALRQEAKANTPKTLTEAYLRQNPNLRITPEMLRKPGAVTPFADWRAANPNAPVGEYFAQIRKGTAPSELGLFESNPAEFNAYQQAKHRFDKGPATIETETPLSPADITTGPDGRTPGVYMRTKTGETKFQPMPGAKVSAATQKAQGMADSINDALSALDDLDTASGVLVKSPGIGVGANRVSMEYRRLTGDPDVAALDSAKSRIIEIASALRKGNRLNAVEFRAIYGGLPGDHDSQESARVKTNNMRQFLQKILTREQSREGSAATLGAAAITPTDPAAAGSAAVSGFLGGP